MRFNFTIGHISGEQLISADVLFRAPVGDLTAPDHVLQQDSDVFVQNILFNMPETEKRLQEIRYCRQKDEKCKMLTNYTLEGWPEKSAVAKYH